MCQCRVEAAVLEFQQHNRIELIQLNSISEKKIKLSRLKLFVDQNKGVELAQLDFSLENREELHTLSCLFLFFFTLTFSRGPYGLLLFFL